MSPTVSQRIDAEVASGRLDDDPAQRTAARRLDALRSNALTERAGAWMRFRARAHPPRGVYLWGAVGRGKTLLMDLFVDTLRGTAVAVERSHFYHFMRDVHLTLGTVKERADPLDLVARRFAERVRILCLDEFLVADIADAMILAGLFDGLFKQGVTLVITSNVAPQYLYEGGLQRQRFLPAIDLLQQHVDVIHLDGGVDHRLRRLSQAPVYFDSNREDTAAALSARFAALAAGRATGAATLCIEGRVLRAVDTAPGMAWFEFSELCEGPRSQNDYIELARLHHTVVIAHIPLLDAMSENAARRFVMLIDEFYDRGVRILISAAAAPADLYRGGLLAFEFERAISRLMEMQTEQYLAGEHRP